MKSTRMLTLLLAAALLAAPSFGAGAQMTAATSQITWTPDFAHGEAVLTVSGPDDFYFTKTFGEGETPAFSMAGVLGEMPKGSYTWSLTATSKISPELRAELEKARTLGDDRAQDLLKTVGFQSFTESGDFTFDGAQFVVPQPGLEVLANRNDVPTKDQLILDDLIVDGSACVGQDCVNGESFGFDTIRLKENNLRIRAQDTSNTASFPSTDWELTFNDSGNGGANYFGVMDATAGRTPFRVEGGAPANTLYVEADGDVGIKTANPVVDIHVVEGNTPTLRLEQDGSDGFTPQTYDLAANEANFFIRDVTNGSKLAFRMKPGAPEDSIYVAANGDVGIGTDGPGADLEVRETAAGNQLLLYLRANGIPQMVLQNDDAAVNQAWRLDVNGAGDFRWVDASGGVTAMVLEDATGNALFNGTITVNTGNLPSTTYPDYVFEDGYDLMPLSDLAEFIEAEGHLPRIPSYEEVKETGGLNMTEMQLKLLEKIEELTLYTLSQQEQIEQQQAAMAEMQAKLEALTQD